MRAVMSLALLTVLSVVIGACGNESRHDVRISVEQIASIGSEGALMAHDVAQGRTKTTFVRVHGDDLSMQAEHEAEKLNDDPVDPDLKDRIPKALKLAADIGGAIDDLRVSPGDRGQARQAEQNLRRWASEARKLAQSI
jgi:4-hydroxy-3-methylbut-2-en-1-yl diphosphate synthase IspG/GcpE